MKIFTRIAVLFYVTLVLFLGTTMLLFILDILSYENVQTVLYGIHVDNELKLVFGIVAGVLLFMNFIFYKTFSVNMHKEKIIAFDNPSGRVSVSLAALEDLIRRKLFKLTEINEVKPTIIASKKGLLVKLRIVFSSEINIPEATSKVQELVKRKVHDTIGLDEPVDVTIYVGKILPGQTAEKSITNKSKEPDVDDRSVPFHGYRA